MTVLNPVEDKRADERLGAYLTRAREARSMSVTDLAVETKLSEKNINLIEASEWKEFPIEAYLRGYLNSISNKLGLDPKRVLDWYAAECGSKYASLLSDFAEPKASKSTSIGESKSSNKIIPIVVVIVGLLIVVASHFLSDVSKASSVVEAAKAEPTPVAEPVEEPEMPEGAEAVAVDSLAADSTETDSAKTQAPVVEEKLSQAVVDEAVKKSDLPASATIFISSTSSKKDSAAVEAPKTKKTRIELIGSGEMRSWIGIKRHEEDNAFLREANIASAGTKMVFNAEDTVFVVIGEPRAISKMILNGKETEVPGMKFGRVTRFHVFGGKVISSGAH